MTNRKYIISTICKTLESLNTISDNINSAYGSLFELEKIRKDDVDDDDVSDDIGYQIHWTSDHINCINNNKNFAKLQLKELKDKLIEDLHSDGGDFL